MTLALGTSFLLAALFGVAVGGLYLVWPRRPTAEEWVLHRRAVGALGSETVGVGAVPSPRWARLPAWLSGARYREAIGRMARGLALLRLGGLSSAPTAEGLMTELGRLAALGATLGLLAGLSFLLLQGERGLPVLALPLALLTGLALPAARWAQLQLRARRLRASLRRRLPRVLTGARMLLESGAATPQAALADAVSHYRDPAADLLREGLRLKEVRRLELEAALDQVGETYDVDSLHRLADAFRVGSRYGTEMSSLLADFAQSLRQGWHAEYRERITRAPVLMTVPALVFFVGPLLVLIMFLVFSPLLTALRQL